MADRLMKALEELETMMPKLKKMAKESYSPEELEEHEEGLEPEGELEDEEMLLPGDEDEDMDLDLFMMEGEEEEEEEMTSHRSQKPIKKKRSSPGML